MLYTNGPFDLPRVNVLEAAQNTQLKQLLLSKKMFMLKQKLSILYMDEMF